MMNTINSFARKSMDFYLESFRFYVEPMVDFFKHRVAGNRRSQYWRQVKSEDIQNFKKIEGTLRFFNAVTGEISFVDPKDPIKECFSVKRLGQLILGGVALTPILASFISVTVYEIDLRHAAAVGALVGTAREIFEFMQKKEILVIQTEAIPRLI